MSEFDFRDLVSGLVDWRLISYDETKKTYTIHPLIKTFFESTFDMGNKKHCHKHIYQYFGLYAPEQPETLEEMHPLFEQIYHGCAAGLYDEVFNNIYWGKIHRGKKHFVLHSLGAWETDLSLVRTFFQEDDLSQMPLVSEKSNQSWLINTAGLALLAIGRPKEAEEPFLSGVKMAIEDKNWENASVGYFNLTILQFQSGEFESGLESAKKALDAADKADSIVDIINPKAYLAWILHLMGKDKEAEKGFKEADELSIEIEGNRLRTFSGVRYADFLISMKRIDEAYELTKQNL
ncbi:MAG: hypothetical protein IMF19_03680, partial [Proteobacteria bacterium]|nr:hypothetical protein [Pseudomonadota bacterium]